MSAAGQHGYVTHDHVLYPQGITVDAGESRLPVSKNITVSDAGSLNFSVHIDVEDVVLGGGEEIKIWLQKHINDNWIDAGDPQATVLVDSGDGTYCIILSSDLEIEAMILPLSNNVRVAIDTGATSSLKVTRITTYERI